MLFNKQNVFSFAYAAKYLHTIKLVLLKLLLKVAQTVVYWLKLTMLQNPELFKVALPEGVMDMLRFHKFTIGWVGP